LSDLLLSGPLGEEGKPRPRATGLGTIEALGDVKIEDLAERLGRGVQRASWRGDAQ